MKTRILTLCMIGTIAMASFAQTTDVLVSQGRGFLVQKDAVNAKARFESALALSPGHADANALLAATRLMTLANTTEGSALLDRLGMSPLGRNFFQWHSDVPLDANGQRIMPVGVSASELSAFLRTNIIPALRASETNLARITNSSYTLLLNSAETSTENVIIDYGDIQMLRAALRALEYLGLTISSWNFDAQLTTIQSYVTNENASAQEFLAAYPQLLTFSSTNDLFAAKLAFVSGAELYFAASDLIRARPQNLVRLFNIDPEYLPQELAFRRTLTDLTNSLATPVMLVENTNYTIHLASHFNDSASPRSFLPSFFGNGFLIGSLPDSTFGGLVQGLSRADVEEFLAQGLNPIQQITGTALQAPRRFSVGFPTLANHYYSIERSTDLEYWESVADFRASGSTYNYTETSSAAVPVAYFRLVDLSKYFSIEGRVVDACSGLPISNAWVTTLSDPYIAATDASGRFFLQTMMPPQFTQVDVFALASGHMLAQQQVWAGEDISDYVIGLSPWNSPPQVNDNFANRILLSGASPSGSGSTCGATSEAGEPQTGQTVWWSWTAPFSGNVEIRVDANGVVPPEVYAYTGNTLQSLVELFPAPVSSYLNVTAGTTYQLCFVSTANASGFQFSIAGQPTLTLNTPANGDSFVAPASIPFSGIFTAPGGVLREARFFANDKLIATTTNSVISFVWSNVPPNSYALRCEGEDSNGMMFGDYRFISVRPANDNFSNRTLLSGAKVVAEGNNTLASSELGEPNRAGGSGGHSLWWSWTAVSNGPVTVMATGDNYNAQLLAIYSGLTLSNLTLVASNYYWIDNGSQLTFNAIAGNTYQIAVDGYWYWQGEMLLSIMTAAIPTVSIVSPTNGQTFLRGQSITIQAVVTDSDGTIQNVSFSDLDDILFSDSIPPFEWILPTPVADGFHYCSATALDSQGLVGRSIPIYFFVVPPPPLNDHFTNRFQLTGSSLTSTGYNTSASKEMGEPNHGGSVGGASAWWQWTPTSNGLAVVSTLGSTFDTLLGVYQGSTVSNLSLIASNNNDGALMTSRVSFPVAAGTAYQIAVDGNSGGRGDINFSISMPAQSTLLADALDTTNFVWSGSSTAWTTQSTITHDTIDAAQSGVISNGQETWMETIITGPGSGNFWWLVSSEANYDFLTFEIDGVQQAAISGTPTWANRAFTLGVGSHVLRWRYSKDGSQSVGSDRGWVDQLTFIPGM